jgi:hypothetical protein
MPAPKAIASTSQNSDEPTFVGLYLTSKTNVKGEDNLFIRIEGNRIDEIEAFLKSDEMGYKYVSKELGSSEIVLENGSGEDYFMCLLQDLEKLFFETSEITECLERGHNLSTLNGLSFGDYRIKIFRDPVVISGSQSDRAEFRTEKPKFW